MTTAKQLRMLSLTAILGRDYRTGLLLCFVSEGSHAKTLSLRTASRECRLQRGSNRDPTHSFGISEKTYSLLLGDDAETLRTLVTTCAWDARRSCSSSTGLTLKNSNPWRNPWT